MTRFTQGIVLIVSIAAAITAIFSLYTVKYSPSTLLIMLLSIILGSAVALVSLLGFQRYLPSSPISYTVAIIGFPKSGKTTLIVSLFGEVFAGKIQNITLTPKGSSTIERVNKSLSLLESGQAVGPTSSQDRFAFRADLTLAKKIFRQAYKIEFGDFPGENSFEYTQKYGEWLHTTEFFKWVVDSDAMVFVIDIGNYLNSYPRSNYVAQISAALRAALQNYLDANSSRIKIVRKHPVVLIFNKADLLCHFNFTQEVQVVNHEVIEELGFGLNTPKKTEIDAELLKKWETQIKDDFHDLIEYFGQEMKNFNILFVSSFGLQNGKRLGLSELVGKILPPQ